MADAETRRLAVLIDAENASPGLVGAMLGEIATFGRATVKRVYGDLSAPALRGWKEVALEHSIQPVLQYNNTRGKNASDVALVIDAMDLLHSRRLDGFCIVSSDSDFTRLASRMREEGVLVVGFGERKTPASFVAACDRFLYTEILRGDAATTAPADRPAAKPSRRRAAKASAAAPRAPATRPSIDRDQLLAVLSDAVGVAADEEGWADLGQLGQIISNRLPDFDPRNFGHGKLSTLLQATDAFEERSAPGARGGQRIAVRLRTPR